MCIYVRVKRDIKGPLPVRVRVRFRLSGILSCFPFSDILSSGIFSGIRFGLHHGNPWARTSIIHILVYLILHRYKLIYLVAAA